MALVAATTVAIVYGVRTNGANTSGAFSEGSVKTSIQGYLDALAHRDVDTIERNALCGLYDGIRDRRSDQALAKLSSDAFRKQFSEVEVTSIDKVVYLSQYQVQALFTMKVSPVAGGPLHGQVQGIAQLLLQRNQILVCSYVLRTAAELPGSVKRVAAGARTGGVGVVDGETLLLDGVDEVDRRAFDVGRAHPVHR